MTTATIDRSATESSVPYAGTEEHVDAAFHAAARAADAELCELIQQTNRSKALQSGVLERIALARYYRAFGFSSVQAYAAHRGVEPSERKAKELCALEARLERLPDIRAAYLAGEFEWTKVRDAAPAITPENEHVWLERLRDEGPDRVTQKIPPMTANYVLARDDHRCQVPLCKNMAFIDLHHEGGREVVGHDPEDICVLCTEHHRARHLGHFRIDGRGRDRRFFLPDGSEIGARRPLASVPHVGSASAVPHVGNSEQEHHRSRRN